MKIIQEVDTTAFYNLTIEDKNGQSKMLVTKYSPTQNWLNDKKQPFEGTITSFGDGDFNNPTNSVTDLTWVFDHEGGAGEESLPSEFSPEYPWDCDGIVLVTYETLSLCYCMDHLPGNCSPQGCSDGFRDVQIPYYSCMTMDDGWSGNDPNDPVNTDPDDDLGQNPSDTGSPSD
ncbi:hypothetical protein [Winogradskyella algicola]|uniref:hypothetical protein n=1 Tax=Winogradskyella algicola TaxID=2575815 RepID=UPI001109BD9D|nr:hypothetical protein [Winogradskyella algicola]